MIRNEIVSLVHFVVKSLKSLLISRPMLSSRTTAVMEMPNVQLSDVMTT